MKRPFLFTLGSVTIVVHNGIPFLYTYSEEFKKDVLLCLPSAAQSSFIGAVATLLDNRPDKLRLAGKDGGHSWLLIGNGVYRLKREGDLMIGTNPDADLGAWLSKLVAFNGFYTVVEALGGRCIGGRPWEDPSDAIQEAEDLRSLLEDSRLTQELVDLKAGFIYRTTVETDDDCAEILRRVEAAGFTLEAARASVASCVRGPDGGPQVAPADGFNYGGD